MLNICKVYWTRWAIPYHYSTDAEIAIMKKKFLSGFLLGA